MMDLIQPANATELAEAVGAAAAKKRSIAISGNVTKTRWAGPPADADACISTTKMDRVLQYEPKDLTISVEAGMPFAAFTKLLADNRQMVPLDPPYSDNATVGGVIAANHSGPRRRLYGTARDLVIGMQFATVEGKLIQSGGMVVKNVAGLDMGKLMIGSWGTLGAIATVNFKLIPLEKHTRTFLKRFDSAASALAERTKILQSVLQPAAVDLINNDGGWTLAIGVGGIEALVDRYSRELSGAEVLNGPAERTFWRGIETFAETFLAANPNGAIVRYASAFKDQLAALDGHNGPILARAANGVTYRYYEAAPASLTPIAGATMLMEAGPATRDAVTMWPAPGSDFPVMQRVKNMLDPKGLLNKGRLYGRI
ncbi:MAG: FAD-binding oxidoreductase [Acidobacteria bacterium]|nr:FAD-binding oxidoreductase [Acidobacteriota bacterium]